MMVTARPMAMPTNAICIGEKLEGGEGERRMGKGGEKCGREGRKRGEDGEGRREGRREKLEGGKGEREDGEGRREGEGGEKGGRGEEREKCKGIMSSYKESTDSHFHDHKIYMVIKYYLNEHNY